MALWQLAEVARRRGGWFAASFALSLAFLGLLVMDAVAFGSRLGG